MGYKSRKGKQGDKKRNKVELQGNQINLDSRKGRDELFKIISCCPYIESLNLSSCKITDQNLNDLANEWPDNFFLYNCRYLMLSCNLISEMGLSYLAEIFSKLPFLSVVYLDRNRITDITNVNLDKLVLPTIVNFNLMFQNVENVSNFREIEQRIEINRQNAEIIHLALSDIEEARKHCNPEMSFLMSHVDCVKALQEKLNIGDSFFYLQYSTNLPLHTALESIDDQVLISYLFNNTYLNRFDELNTKNLFEIGKIMGDERLLNIIQKMGNLEICSFTRVTKLIS